MWESRFKEDLTTNSNLLIEFLSLHYINTLIHCTLEIEHVYIILCCTCVRQRQKITAFNPLIYRHMSVWKLSYYYQHALRQKKKTFSTKSSSIVATIIMQSIIILPGITTILH